MKLNKATRSVMTELTSKKLVKESIMAELNLLAQESKTYKEFEQKFKQEYSQGHQLDPEEVELLQQLYNGAKDLGEGKKARMVEVVSSPVDREIVTMICEVAAEYGVQNIPKKKWSSTTKLIQYLAERVKDGNRVQFVKTVKKLRESMQVEEFVIDVASTKKK